MKIYDRDGAWRAGLPIKNLDPAGGVYVFSRGRARYDEWQLSAWCHGPAVTMSTVPKIPEKANLLEQSGRKVAIVIAAADREYEEAMTKPLEDGDDVTPMVVHGSPDGGEANDETISEDEVVWESGLYRHGAVVESTDYPEFRQGLAPEWRLEHFIAVQKKGAAPVNHYALKDELAAIERARGMAWHIERETGRYVRVRVTR